MSTARPSGFGKMHMDLAGRIITVPPLC